MDDEELLRFSICLSFPEIFAIKVDSCQKSRKILGRFFAVRNFFGVGGRALYKVCPFCQPCLAGRRLKKSREDTPSSREVIECNTLNFRTDVYFSG